MLRSAILALNFLSACIAATVQCTSGFNGTVPTPQALDATTVRIINATDANQGVAVGGGYMYSIDNYSITKRSKGNGSALLQWYGGANGQVIHLDGGFVKDGMIVCPHSNYNTAPETSSVEFWNATTMTHIKSHTFGINRGSMTWVDYFNGTWWGAFANYDRVMTGQTQPYGLTMNTQLVQFDDDFNVVRGWIYPQALWSQFSPMSNSGGSFGPDGFLYITGHDDPLIYVLQVPAAGSVVIWVATISAPAIAGQGIAWDRDTPGNASIYGIARDSLQIVEMKVPLQECAPQVPTVGATYGPGSFKGKSPFV